MPVLRTSYRACPVNPSRRGYPLPGLQPRARRKVVPRYGFSRARVPRSGTGEARAASIIRTGREERAAKPASLSRYAGEERSGACSGSSTMSPSQRLASARPALAPESYCLVTDATPAAAANARSCFRARRSPEAPPHAPRKPVSP